MSSSSLFLRVVALLQDPHQSLLGARIFEAAQCDGRRAA